MSGAEINLVPDSILETQIAFSEITSKTLTIQKLGVLTLTWAITEEESIVIPIVENITARTTSVIRDNGIGASGPVCDTFGDNPWLTAATTLLLAGVLLWRRQR